MQILLLFSVQGNADPQYNLSGIYRIGQGFLRDDAETLKLVLSVVDQDNCDES